MSDGIEVLIYQFLCEQNAEFDDERIRNLAAYLSISFTEVTVFESWFYLSNIKLIGQSPYNVLKQKDGLDLLVVLAKLMAFNSIK